MIKVPTASELIIKMTKDNLDASISEMMIEFANIHVKEALLYAANSAKMMELEVPYTGVRAGGSYYIKTIDKESILNAYPKNNIK